MGGISEWGSTHFFLIRKELASEEIHAKNVSSHLEQSQGEFGKELLEVVIKESLNSSSYKISFWELLKITLEEFKVESVEDFFKEIVTRSSDGIAIGI